MPKESKSIRFAVNNFAVDTANGILTNLALITADREASGHGIYIDAKTLESGISSVKERGGQLKGVVCHETFLEWMNDEDRLLQVPGYFDSISIKGNKLVAGKFEFYESFRSDQPNAYRRLMEMAEKTPNLFGLSIEATGYAVYVDTDGNEYSQRPEDTELMHDGMPVFRIVNLSAAAFVSEPAANDGLFALAMKALRGREKISKDKLDEISKSLVRWNSTHGTNFYLNNNALEGQSTTTEQSKMEKLLKEIKEKFGKDEARQNRAVLFAVNHPDGAALTIDQVEAALSKAELDDLRASNTKLKEQLENKASNEDSQEDELAKLKQKNQDLENRFEKFKNSGMEGDLAIGAPAIVGSGVKFTGKTKALIDQGVVSSDKIDSLNKKFSENSLSVHDFADGEIIAGGLSKHYKSGADISANFAAGTTSIADLWTPENQVQGGGEFQVQKPSLINSGAVASNPILNQAASVGGNQVKVESFIEPYFDSLLQVESTAPTVQKIGSGQQLASTLRRVSPLSVSSFAGAISGSDPWGFILRILSNLRNLQDQTTLVNILRGFTETAAAALSNDQFTEDVDTDGTTGRLIDGDMFIDTVSQLGEAKSLFSQGLMIVHSDIEAALLKQESITTVRDSSGQFVMRSYKGNIPLLTSDMLSRPGTTTGTVYETYIFGPGAIGLGSKTQTGNVGDTASILIKEDEATNDLSVYDRRQFILHPTGAKWTGTPADADSGPTNAELATGGNWALGVSDVKRCGFVRLRTNG